MTKAARNWRTAILLVVLIGVAGVFAYRVIAGTTTASSACPPSLTCPSTTNCPPQAEVDKACPVKGASDKEACKLLSDDARKKVCPLKGQSDKKAGCDKTEKKCGLRI